MKSDRLYLFDFDGTITTKDSLFPFLRFARGGFFFCLSMVLLSPVLAAHVAGLINAQKTKEMLLGFFLRGTSSQKMKELGKTFVGSRVRTMLNHGIVSQFREAIASGAVVAVVSASCDCWIRPFCEEYGADCICTELEYDANGFFTGKFRTPNCNGAEKKKRVEEKYALKQFSSITAFGNSSADHPMMELADEKIMV